MPRRNKTLELPAIPKLEDLAEEHIPDIRELEIRPADRLKLARLLEQSAAMGAEESKIAKQRKKINTQIKVIMAQIQCGKLLHGEIKALYFNVPRTTLSKEKLLENGVEPDVIADSMETTDCYMLRVTTIKSGEEEE
jgi:hypothetical protein